MSIGLKSDSSGTSGSIVINGSDKVVVTSAGNVTAGTFTGAVVGAVTGNVTGNVTGTLTAGGSLTSGTAVASTGGTAIDFTSIPSWAKRITVMFGSTAISTSDIPMIRLGYGGGTFSTSGYGGTAQDATTSQQLSSGILLGVDGSSGYLRSGFLTLSLLTANNWTFNGIIGHTSDVRVPRVAGNVTIGGTLDRVRITSNSAGTFTGGTVNIMYEG
jgi:hypothetical protein